MSSYSTRGNGTTGSLALANPEQVGAINQPDMMNRMMKWMGGMMTQMFERHRDRDDLGCNLNVFDRPTGSPQGSPTGSPQRGGRRSALCDEPGGTRGLDDGSNLPNRGPEVETQNEDKAADAETQLQNTIGDLTGDSEDEERPGKTKKAAGKLKKRKTRGRKKTSCKRPAAASPVATKVGKKCEVHLSYGLEITRHQWQGRSPWGNRSFPWCSGKAYRNKVAAEEARQAWLQSLCKTNSLPRYPKDKKSMRV